MCWMTDAHIAAGSCCTAVVRDQGHASSRLRINDVLKLDVGQMLLRTLM
jgi:hypothetical protein